MSELKLNPPKPIIVDWNEVEEIAKYIVGLPDDVDGYDIDQLLFDKFEITFEQFRNVVQNLLPMIDVGTSELSGNKYIGFSKPIKGTTRLWLIKMQVQTAKKKVSKKKKNT